MGGGGETEGALTIDGGHTPPAVDSYYFYMIKVDQGILFADRTIDGAKSSQMINKANKFKGSGFRCPTLSEIVKYLSSDLNGMVTPYYSTNGINRNTFRIVFSAYAIPLQDYDSTRNEFIQFHQSSFDYEYNTFTYSNISFMPVYEYVDNSKSTNIYY